MPEQQTRKALVLTDIMLEIFRLYGKLLDKGDDLVGPLRLTSSDWQLLGAVALANQPMTAPMIAEAMGLTRQGTQKRLNRMVEDGYFERRDNPRHERSSIYALSARGTTAFAGAMRLHARWANDLVTEFGRSDLDRTLKLLRRLGERLDATAVPRPRSARAAAAAGKAKRPSQVSARSR